jgi:hypothetical protein
VAWDHAVSTHVVGPSHPDILRLPISHTQNIAPSTPAHANNTTSPTTILRTHNTTLSPHQRRHITTVPTSHTRNAAPSVTSSPSSNFMSLTESSSSSMSLSDGSSGGSHPVLLSPSSSQASASCLASIMAAFDELALDSPVPHYVVLRGNSPGVYANWYNFIPHLSNIN